MQSSTGANRRAVGKKLGRQVCSDADHDPNTGRSICRNLLIGRVMDQSELISMLDFLAEMHMPILDVRCSFYYQNLFEVFFVRSITFNV